MSQLSGDGRSRPHSRHTVAGLGTAVTRSRADQKTITIALVALIPNSVCPTWPVRFLAHPVVVEPVAAGLRPADTQCRSSALFLRQFPRKA